MHVRWQGSCLRVTALFVLIGSCHAQSATPDQEYQKLVQVDQNVDPVGEHPFGENINPYDGSVSFNITDVSLRGNGPTITIGRSFQSFEWVSQESAGPQLPFGSWELDIPRIETLVGSGGAIASSAVWQTGLGGTTPTEGTTNRCTTFAPPPGIKSSLAEGGWVPDEWWYGYNLWVPGAGKQQLMPRYSANALSPTIDGMSFQIVTKSNWMIGCGVTASDGGEGFLAVAPDGTRYTFAHLLYRPYFPIVGSGGLLPPDGTIIATSSTSSARSAVLEQGASSVQGASPMAAGPGGVGTLARRDAFMYVTQIQDRLGNTLTYNYDPTSGYLSSITASDGREVDIAYVPGSWEIQTITAKATNVGSRTWAYSYTNGELTSVQLPDGSAWTYQLGNGEENLYFRNSNCSLNVMPQVGDFTTPTTPGTLSGTSFATITSPSGLTGTFGFALKLSGRSYTPQWCYGSSNGTQPASVWPEWYVQDAITSEVITGAGMPAQTWTYSYSPSNVSWDKDPCATSGTCPTTVYTDVTDPNGNDTRYTFSNRFDATEGQLLRADSYQGAYGGALAKSAINTYASATAGPWPSVYGVDLAYRDNYYQTEQVSPLSQKVITQDGQNYTWQAMTFNAYAQPTDVKRYNDIAGQTGIEEATAYLNDTNLWVLGLPQTVTNVGTGEVESSNVYNGQDLLQQRSHFGEFMMSYTYNSAGQLASFTDGNQQTTHISNYYRGIPQSINFPDGNSESLTVDDLSQITSITDQNGNTTHYSYDSIGRIAQIAYPTSDTVSWYPKVFTYRFVGSERGITGNHWDRTTTVGNAITTTYFDADLRPVLSDTSNGSQDITTATAYDYTGATTFASYPVYGQPAVTDPSISTGTHHTYDPLERVIQTQEDNGTQAPIVTSTAYLSGAGEQVTDPNGNVTTTHYQVFDEPDYKDPILVVAPGGITQTIVRDIYGNPRSITQSGLYGTESDSVTKTLLYDSYYRLCRTTEPESGSTVMAYDGANNLAWSAQGQAIPDGTCGQGDVASAAQTVRTYDPMNRVLSITPPAGTQATSYTYDGVGNVTNANSGVTQQKFAYNTRNMVTKESLSVPGYAWSLGYTYDGYGHISTIGYPSYNGSSQSIAYSPDALGRATQVGSYASGITYFPNNQVAGFNFGNGASYVAEQNARQLLSSFGYGAGSTISLSEGFTYDNDGNITAVADQVPNGPRSKSFTYDALNRLASATAGNLYGVESYSYDALNNLRSRVTGGNTLTLNYDATNRLASVAQNGSVVTQYGYDTQGNRNSLTNGGTTINYSFDAENQLLQVSGVEGYAYDAAGRRVTKTGTNGAVSAYYFYDQAGQLMYEFDPGTATATNYLYLGTKLIDKHATQQLAVPTGVVVMPNPNDGNFTVSWNAVADATSYTLQTTNGLSGTTVVYSGSSTSVALTVSTGGTQFYQLQACNSSGCSGWADVSASVWPAIPTFINLPSGTDNGGYNVTWTAPAGANTYDLQVSTDGGTTWTALATGTTSTSFPQPGNVSGTYIYRVQSHNRTVSGTAGWGTSPPVTVNTNYGVIPTPTPTLTVPATSYTGSATITWTAATPVTSYTLQQSVNGGSTWTTVYTGIGTTATVTGLGNGSYVYQLQACNTAGGGSACTSLVRGGPMVVTLPPSPAPTASMPGGSNNYTGSYIVDWSANNEATSYTVQEQINGGAWTTVQTGTGTAYDVTGKTDASYGYRVQGCNVGGCSAWSNTVITTVLLAPAAPSLSGGGTSNNGSYGVSWNATATATGYNLQENVNGGGWTTVQSGSATSWSTSGRGNGSYAYQVQACNATCSGWSNVVTETVALIPVTPAETVKQTSTGTMIIATVTWNTVPNATSYVLQEETGTTVTQMYSGSGTSWSGGYAYGALRSFRVQACNSSGCSPWSGWAQ